MSDKAKKWIKISGLGFVVLCVISFVAFNSSPNVVRAKESSPRNTDKRIAAAKAELENKIKIFFLEMQISRKME